MRTKRRNAVLCLAVGLAASGCCQAVPDPTQPVTLQIAAAPPAGGTIAVRSLRMVVRHAAFVDPAGCTDCWTDLGTGPRLVSVPPDGRPMPVDSEDLGPGHYAVAELELAPPGPAILNSTPDWPDGVTIEIEGECRGAPFILRLAIEGTARDDLPTPLEVRAAGAGGRPVTLTVPIADWFRQGDAWLDPGDSAQRVLIAANVRRTFQAPVTP